MATRKTKRDKKTLAFDRLAIASGKYLATIGWTAIVLGPVQIERFPLDAAHKYRLVLDFLGGPVPDHPGDAER